MKPFLHGKKSIAVAPLRPHQRSVPVHAPETIGTPSHDTRAPGTGCAVEVIKEGDKVSRIVVTCTCGERVEITCLYPAGS
jgi:hypothetical protein